jgi:hypothetical protein
LLKVSRVGREIGNQQTRAVSHINESTKLYVNNDLL